MPWNWEHKSWPTFIYETERLANCEKEFLHKGGMLHGSLNM